MKGPFTKGKLIGETVVRPTGLVEEWNNYTDNGKIILERLLDEPVGGRR